MKKFDKSYIKQMTYNLINNENQILIYENV